MMSELLCILFRFIMVLVNIATNECALLKKISPMDFLMVTDDWRYRHAALMAISACGEGCHQQMETMLGNVLEAILPFLKDPVRY